MTRVAGADALALLDQLIAEHAGGIASRLAPLDPVTTTRSWLEMLRAIEELINLPMMVDLETRDRFRRTPIVSMYIDPRPIHSLARHLADLFDAGVAARFTMLCKQCCMVSLELRVRGNLEAAMGLHTVAEAMGYFQSRRRHLVTLLYTMPSACKGQVQVAPADVLGTFIPLVEHCAMSLTGLHQNAMLGAVYPDFELVVDARGFKGSHSLDILNSLFLEPERLPIVEIDPGVYNSKRMLPLDPRKVISTVEARNAIPILEEAYREFDLAGTQFAAIAAICDKLLDHAHDDYFIRLPKAEFDTIVGRLSAGKFIQRGEDFVVNSNSYAPCIEVAGEVLSTVLLVQRFLYYFKNVCLNKVKRFQIRSGFELEKAVKEELRRRGLSLSNTKRIEQQEFDVLATHQGVLFNVQCKNNFVDVTRIESNRKLFVRYNRGLDRAYALALAKEEEREHLLRKRFGDVAIRHLVVSRFPVATSNPRVLSFADLQKKGSAALPDGT